MLEQSDLKNYLTMEEDDLLTQDLSTMIIIIGSYLFSGGSIDDVDDIVLDRMADLIGNHLDGLKENTSMH